MNYHDVRQELASARADGESAHRAALATWARTQTFAEGDVPEASNREYRRGWNDAMEHVRRQCAGEPREVPPRFKAEHSFIGDGHDCGGCGEGRQHYLHSDREASDG